MQTEELLHGAITHTRGNMRNVRCAYVHSLKVAVPCGQSALEVKILNIKTLK